MSKIPAKRVTTSPPKIVFRPRQTTTAPHQRLSLNNALKIGDRVTATGKSGTIAFIGSTKFAEGEWIGINLDEPQGKNDGSHGGIRYFETDANHGLFCRPDKVQRLSINGARQRHSLYDPLRLSSIEDASNNVLGITTIDTSDLSSTKNLQIGDRVIVQGTKIGTLKYIGKVHIGEGMWCGIKLDGPLGKHDGQIQGTRYFKCPPRYGLFAPLHHVEKVVLDPHDVRALNRQSVISTDSINQYLDSASQDSNLSELSASPKSSNDFPTRSPKKIKQPNLSAIETPYSNQITQLQETIKEKDLSLENLQRKYEMKERENENLCLERLELTQRLEDLQFQLEEEQLNIPDDHRLLSPDEIKIYEKIEKRMVELESINNKLLQEKQMLEEALERQDQFEDTSADKLNEQIQLLKSQLIDLQNKEQIQTELLTEKELSYQQQIEEYQTQIDQITEEEQNVRLRLTTLEREKQFNDKRIHDLLDELKRHKETIVPELEDQCQMLKFELQNRNQTDNTASNERELYYEQQIKEYQANINQATYQTEQIREELKQIQEENHLTEKRTTALINELKENYEKVQIELNDRERQVRESQYENQINEYENNLHRATQETENIQAELTKLEEEKLLHDQKTNNLINSIKQDYERQYEILKNQLNELQDQDGTDNVILNERIAHYELEIKEYQMKIDQDAQRMQNLLDEFKSLQEEKISCEEELNKTIETLKLDCEELRREIDELNERERKAHKTLHQREAQFEQQITGYEGKVEQADLTTQQLQAELEKLQEEKTNFNNTISSLREELETLKNELQDRDQTEKTTSNEHEAEYKAARDQSLLQIQDLQSQLTNLQEEKATMEDELNETINILQHDYEKLQNEQELDAQKILHQHDVQFEQQIKEYEEKLEQTDLTIQHLQSELEKLQKEKTNFNDTINSLTEELETLKTELQDRDRTENTTSNEHEAEYKAARDQSLLEIQDLQSKLTNLQEEKTTIEDELNETINTLKQDYEELQNKQELDAQKILHQHDVQFEQQIKEYEEKLGQTDLTIQHLQLELEKLQEEKTNFNETINSLTEELETLKTELQDRDRPENTTSNEHEAEYKAERDQSLLEIQDLQSKLTNLQEEKTTIEDELNETINTLKQEYEKLYNEQQQKEKSILKECHSQYEQEIDEYQKNLELAIHQTENIQLELNNLQEEKESYEQTHSDRIESLKLDFENQIQILKTQNIELQKQNQTKEQQLKEYQSTSSEIDELRQRIENLTQINKTLVEELDDVKSQHDPTEVEQLTEQINALQQMHMNLLEKQATREQQYVEEKNAQEKIFKDKIDEFEMKIAMIKNEYMVEMENTKLDHDQEVLRLKAQIPKPAPTKGKK